MKLISLIVLSCALPFIHGEFKPSPGTNARRTLSESTTLCSAITAYVEVSATKNNTINTFTILSAHASFPPHSYYVNWTDLVSISETENVCNVSAPSSINIVNRSVLLYELMGNCSAHTKVIWAQQNNAIAVLMANNEDTNIVHNLVDDNTSTASDQSRIPMRSISKTEAQNVQELITTGFAIQIKIVCSQNETYSSILCVTDNIRPTADWPITMGEYQRQEDEEYNGHPIWKMEGYPRLHSTKFMFLHDAKDDSYSYWVIAERISSASNNTINLQCTTGNIRDPTLCPLWADPNTDVQPHIKVLGSVCVPPPTNYSSTLCVSSQYEVPGLLGTYHRFWQNDDSTWMPNTWMRELSECDHLAACLHFKIFWNKPNNFTTIYDVITEKKYAQCHSISAQSPEQCKEWKRLDSKTLRMITDKTFNVTIGACADTPPCVKTEAPERFCLANSSVVNGNLMGEYVRINERGPHFNSSIYKRLTPKDTPSTNPWNYSLTPLYIWYFGELQAEFPSSYDTYFSQVWVLSSNDLQEAFSHGLIWHLCDFFSFCYGYAYDNPVNCKTWISGGYTGTNIPYLIDGTMASSDGHCADNLLPDSPSSWPKYICVDLSNPSMAFAGIADSEGSHGGMPAGMANDFLRSLSIDILKPLTGRYVSYVGTNDRFPTWEKEPNEYDDLYNIWPSPILSFNDNLYSSINTLYWYLGSLTCDPYIYQSNSLNPLECKQWFYKQFTIYGMMYTFNLYECTADDVFTVGPTAPPPGSPAPVKAPIAPTKAIISSTAPTKPPTNAITNAPTKAVASSTASTTSPTKPPIQAHMVPTNSALLYPERLCLSRDSYLLDSNLFGEYRLNAQAEYYVLSSLPDTSGYIWRDIVTNYWFVGPALNDSVFVCPFPSDSCYMMDKNGQLSMEIDGHITELGEDQICEDVPLSTMMETEIAKSSEQKAAAGGKVVGPVIGIILCICIAVGIVLFLKYKKDKTSSDQKSIEEKEMIATAVDERDVSTVVEVETIMAPLNEP